MATSFDADLVRPWPPPMPHTRVTIDHLWLIAGMVEELRSFGADIPAEADDIVTESLLRINFAPYLNGIYPKRRARLIEIIESLDLPDGVPRSYRPEDRFTSNPRLKPFTTQHMLEDRVLGVGLKSYPYVIDADGDGRKDLLVGDHDGFIYLFINRGTNAAPAFTRGERLRAVDTGSPLIVQPNPKMTFGDLTGRGGPDLVLGNYGGRVAFLPNRADDGSLAYAMADATFLRTAKGEIDVGNYAYPELVDLRGDGVPDLVVGNIDGEILLFRNACRDGDPRFEAPVEVPGIEPLMYPCASFADWNGDGRLDLVLGHRDGTVWLYANVGTPDDPRFERVDEARHLDGRAVDVGLLSHPVAVDWDEDGLVDLVVGNDPGQVQVFINVGTSDAPRFADPLTLRDDGGELIMGVHSVFAMTDFNGDGRLDLLVGHETDRLRLFPNVGTATKPAFDDYTDLDDIAVAVDALAADDPDQQRFWALRGLEFDTEYLGNLAPCPVDWFDRGRNDLLIGHYSGLVYLFENVGTRTAPRYAPGRPLRRNGQLLRVAGFSTPVVCDWNNDGRLDVICGDLLGRVHVFLNTGGDATDLAGHEMVHIDGEPVMLGPRSIVEVADLDGDGRKDVLVGNRWGDVYALMNVGTDSEPAFDAIEKVRDRSALWRQLYDGCQHALHDGLKKLYDDLPGGDEPAPMNVVETSCPRVVDYDADGRREVLMSHRYGRVFVYDAVP